MNRPIVKESSANSTLSDADGGVLDEGGPTSLFESGKPINISDFNQLLNYLAEQHRQHEASVEALIVRHTDLLYERLHTRLSERPPLTIGVPRDRSSGAGSRRGLGSQALESNQKKVARLSAALGRPDLDDKFDGGDGRTSGTTRASQMYAMMETMEEAPGCWISMQCRKISENKIFELGISFLVFLNAAMLAYQANWLLINLASTEPTWFGVVELLFTFVFTFELVVRGIAEGMFFFAWNNPGWGWNMFDLFIVTTAWGEGLFMVIVPNMPKLSVLRIVRIGRLVRILRIVRVMRFFKELRTMVHGIIVSVKPLIWCLILLACLIFTTGTAIITMAGQSLRDNPALDTEEFREIYGNLFVTIRTLYFSTTGGMDWSDAYLPLVPISWMVSMVFFAYISFSLLCVLNVVTGVFVENANAITRTDSDNMLMEEMSKAQKRLAEMREIFSKAVSQEDDQQVLRKSTFVNFCKNAKIQKYFKTMGLAVDLDNATALFNMIDLDSDGIVTLPDFVDGCTQFTGNSRQLDIARLRRDNANLKEAMQLVVESIMPMHEMIIDVVDILGGAVPTKTGEDEAQEAMDRVQDMGE